MPLIFFGKFVFTAIFGEAFRTSYYPAIILWPAVVIWGFALPIGGHVVGKKRYPMSVALGMALALGVNIALNILFIPYYGAVGAALASLIAYLFMCFTYMYKFYRLFNLSWIQFFSISMQERKVLRQVFLKVLNRYFPVKVF